VAALIRNPYPNSNPNPNSSPSPNSRPILSPSPSSNPNFSTLGLTDEDGRCLPLVSPLPLHPA
jgi:hypothetical protein